MGCIVLPGDCCSTSNSYIERATQRPSKNRAARARVSREEAFALRVRRLARALAAQNDLDRLQEDGQVEKQVSIFQIEEVVLQLFRSVALVRAVGIAKLCPACDTRLDRMPLAVEGDRAIELRDELRPLGPRPHQAHLAREH